MYVYIKGLYEVVGLGDVRYCQSEFKFLGSAGASFDSRRPFGRYRGFWRLYWGRTGVPFLGVRPRSL